jgi:protein MBA1
MSSSSRLGLRARGLFSAGAGGPARIAPPFTNRTPKGLPSAAPFTTSQLRPSNKAHRAALEAYSPRVGAQYSPKVESARRMRGGGIMEVTAASLSMVLPGACSGLARSPEKQYGS